MRGYIMKLAFVLAMLFAAGQRAEAADATRVAGTWNSDYGTVILNISPKGGISGFWNQDKGQGLINSGLFDGDSLAISYYEPWSKAYGTALLRLVPNGRSLTGHWAQWDGTGKEAEGDWVLTRN